MIKIGSITEVGFSDFSASEKLPIVITLNTDRGSGIGTKSPENPTFLKISSRICHFRLDQPSRVLGENRL